MTRLAVTMSLKPMGYPMVKGCLSRITDGLVAVGGMLRQRFHQAQRHAEAHQLG